MVSNDNMKKMKSNKNCVVSMFDFVLLCYTVHSDHMRSTFRPGH